MAWALADEELTVEHTYFEEDDPFVDDSGGTYSDAPGPLPPGRMYEWNHSLGETVTALIRHGLQLVWLREHDWAVWPRFSLAPRNRGRPVGDAARHAARPSRISFARNAAAPRLSRFVRHWSSSRSRCGVFQ